MTYNEYWQVIDAGLKPEELTVFKYEDEGVSTLEDGLYVLEDKLEGPGLRRHDGEVRPRPMKGWKWAEENPDDAAMIVLDNDETGAQTEHHQKQMMSEIAKLTAGSDGTLDPADYERTVKTLLSAGSDPVITKEPEGAWTPRGDRQGARQLTPPAGPRGRPPPAGRRPWPGARRIWAAARALCRRSGRADARSEVRPDRRAGVQPRRAAGALRRRADLPDRAVPAGRPARRRTSPGSTSRSAACPSTSAASNRSGTRFGPRAVRAIERVGPYNHVLDCAPIFDLAVADVGDVPFSSRYDLAGEPPRDRGLDRGDRGAGGAAAERRRRSFDHLSDPARGRRRPAGRARAYRRAFRHRRAVRRAAREPRRAVPQRGAGGRARSDADHPDRAARGVGISLRVRHRERHDLPPRRDGGRDRRRRGGGAGARGGGRRAGLSLLRHRRARSGLRAGHRHAGDRRADHARGAGDPARAEGHRHRRRRPGRGGAAVRRDDQHRACRGADAVRDPEPDGVQPVAEPG